MTPSSSCLDTTERERGGGREGERETVYCVVYTMYHEERERGQRERREEEGERQRPVFQLPPWDVHGRPRHGPGRARRTRRNR